MTTGIVYSPEYLEHIPDRSTHPEARRRLLLIAQILEEYHIYENPSIQLIEPRKATPEEVLAVHSENLFELVKHTSEEGGGYLDPDTVASPKTFEIALLAAGGVIEAVEQCIQGTIENAFAIIRPPGHHATKKRAMGFCFFNNVAIAAKYLLRNYELNKIAILDIDSHHGNGTQDIFYDSSEVLYISLHQDPLTAYPGTGYIEDLGVGEGEGYNVNIPLRPLTTNEPYLYAINEVVVPIIEQYEPEFILVSAGYDTYYRDPLTHMALTTRAYKEIFRSVKALSTTCINKAFVTALEGGYSPGGLQLGILTSISEMADLGIEIEDVPPEDNHQTNYEYTQKIVTKLKNYLSPFWDF
ncbi:MAG: histone deacetylase [Promethearchaeota archaeon]